MRHEIPIREVCGRTEQVADAHDFEIVVVSLYLLQPAVHLAESVTARFQVIRADCHLVVVYHLVGLVHILAVLRIALIRADDVAEAVVVVGTAFAYGVVFGTVRLVIPLELCLHTVQEIEVALRRFGIVARDVVERAGHLYDRQRHAVLHGEIHRDRMRFLIDCLHHAFRHHEVARRIVGISALVFFRLPLVDERLEKVLCCLRIDIDLVMCVILKGVIQEILRFRGVHERLPLYVPCDCTVVVLLCCHFYVLYPDSSLGIDGKQSGSIPFGKLGGIAFFHGACLRLSGRLVATVRHGDDKACAVGRVSTVIQHILLAAREGEQQCGEQRPGYAAPCRFLIGCISLVCFHRFMLFLDVHTLRPLRRRGRGGHIVRIIPFDGNIISS